MKIILQLILPCSWRIDQMTSWDLSNLIFYHPVNWDKNEARAASEEKKNMGGTAVGMESWGVGGMQRIGVTWCAREGEVLPVSRGPALLCCICTAGLSGLFLSEFSLQDHMRWTWREMQASAGKIPCFGLKAKLVFSLFVVFSWHRLYTVFLLK